MTEQSRNSLREWLPWLDVTCSVTDTQTFIQAARKGYGKNRSMTAVILFHRIRKDRIKTMKAQPSPENLASPNFLYNETAGLISINEINWANKTAQIGYCLMYPRNALHSADNRKISAYFTSYLIKGQNVVKRKKRKNENDRKRLSKIKD
ncbi:hypothetical protein NBRC111894_4546 [Sporolactobacillus inulinus]|uniref:Uncharacterized protein n=1 Tax=Sporolactobacillus inulinus TaxID=2078 RepID=A0A4Y1ZIH9_9BACL|nr:hypothetical protein [Sporolactobacillus inulinus]GAY78992.1 hypothetical protein NBRC111894_4546 [Sporolactobacillus inulinus]